MNLSLVSCVAVEQWEQSGEHLCYTFAEISIVNRFEEGRHAADHLDHSPTGNGSWIPAAQASRSVTDVRFEFWSGSFLQQGWNL
jgi:hypothetical protein